MTQDELQKLAEGQCRHFNYSPYSAAFIKGYITCQQTEVAELKKELERVKRLMEHIYKQHAALPATRDLKWDNFKQQNNL